MISWLQQVTRRGNDGGLSVHRPQRLVCKVGKGLTATTPFVLLFGQQARRSDVVFRLESLLLWCFRSLFDCLGRLNAQVDSMKSFLLVHLSPFVGDSHLLQRTKTAPTAVTLLSVRASLLWISSRCGRWVFKHLPVVW